MAADEKRAEGPRSESAGCGRAPFDWAKGPVWLVSITWVAMQVVGLLLILAILLFFGRHFLQGFREGLAGVSRPSQGTDGVSQGPSAKWGAAERDWLGQWDRGAREFQQRVDEFDRDFRERTRRFDDEFQRDLDRHEQRWKGLKRRMQERFDVATAEHTKEMIEGWRRHSADWDQDMAEWKRSFPPSGRPLPKGCPTMGEIMARRDQAGNQLADWVRRGGILNREPLPKSTPVVPPGCPSWEEQFNNSFWEDSDRFNREFTRGFQKWAEREGVTLSRSSH